MAEIEKLLSGLDKGEDETPVVEFEEELPEGMVELPVEGEEEPVPEEDPEKAALKAQIASLEGKISEISSRDAVARGIQEGIMGLREAIQPAPAPGPKVESEEDFKKRFNELVIDNPYEAHVELQRRQFGGPMAALIDRTIRLQTRVLAQDPERGPTYKRFKAEIDRAIAQASPLERYTDPDIVEKIHDRVVSTHLPELRQEDAASMEARITEKIKAQLAAEAAARRTPTPPPHAETGRNNLAARGGAGKVVRVKAEDLLTVDQRRIADAKGMSYENYARFLIRKGVIKNAKV